VASFYFAEIDLNGMDNMGDDSDSIGNAPPRTTRSAPSAGGGFTMPTKEKRKPFFKKVCGVINLVLIDLFLDVRTNLVVYRNVTCCRSGLFDA